MTVAELTKRVERLEKQIARMEERLNGGSEEEEPWWKALHGRWADNPVFDEAMRLGREYRESLRPGKKPKKGSR